MEYNIWLDFCAIFVLAAILFAIYTKHKIPLIQNKIFTLMIWLCIISTTVDMLCGIWNSYILLNIRIFPAWLYYLISMLYFIARNLTPLCFLLYILAILGMEPNSLKQKLFVFSPYIIEVILICITPFTKAVFFLNEEGLYTRGTYLPILYIIAFGYLLASIYYTANYRKSIPLMQLFSLITFVVIAIVTVCIQAVFPTILAEGFGTALCFLLVYFTIQRPEDLADSSTGFLNKKMFSMMLSVKIKQKSPFTILFICINDFNLLEKSYGIDIVDKLMSQMSSFIRHYQKSPSFRIAEDQLVLLINTPTKDKIKKIIEDFQMRFSKSWSVSEYNILLSEFYSIFSYPSEVDTVENIMELINAVKPKKNIEKGTIILAKELDIEKERRKIKLDSIVKEAVNKHALRVVYQPIYSVKEKRFTSAEALLRLKDDELGNIPPDEFIPIAEKNGAIVKMDQFVLDTVCRFSASNHIKELGIEYIEINISAVECLQDDIENSILARISLYGMDAEQINLELTETAMNTLPERVYEKMHYLSERKISFSLDDYGTGYSNLNRMTRLPFKIIKIDKSLAQEAFTSDAIKVILDSTVQMVKKLNKKILVEGIETKEQADYMASIGCDYIQGYYYSKPISPQEFIALLKTSSDKSE